MPTKIVPTDGAAPGHPFNVIDTPEGKLVDGCLLLFRLNGAETSVTLETGSPFKTAKGRVPSVSGGTYDCFAKPPDAVEFSVGTFRVIAEVAQPSISPTAGTAGTDFVITDPQGRMANAQVIKFTLPHEDPSEGTSVQSPSFTSDGTKAMGKVPVTPQFGLHGVSVHNGDPAFNAPLFTALPFDVKAE